MSPMMGPGMMMPPDMMMSTFPEGGEEIKPLTEEEITKLMSQLKTTNEQIEKKRNRLQEIDRRLQDLQERKRRYEMLLVKKSQDIKVSVPSYTPTQQFFPGMMFPGGMQQGFMPGYTQPQTRTTEEENEIIFAINLIITLGELTDRESLSLIKSAWEEFGVSNYETQYALALAQLGDYSKIDLLISRLKQDFSQTQDDNEIKLRVGIVKVLGEYIKTNPDEEIVGLINYLSEEGQYPEIKKVASEVLAFLPKGK